jgi:hypothetical protein
MFIIKTKILLPQAWVTLELSCSDPLVLLFPNIFILHVLEKVYITYRGNLKTGGIILPLKLWQCSSFIDE